MKLIKNTTLCHVALITMLIAECSSARAADTRQATEVDGIAVEAYIYAYPLVTTELTRRRLTNVAAPEGTQAPMGQFAKLRTYPDASYRDVTAPNADTLYTYAYFDVSKEPWVISIPDLKDRFAVFSLFDSWTTVFGNPGKRTTGTGAQTIAITGPGWSGTLPPGVKEYKSGTEIALFNGKIYCTGTPDDYKQVHKLQDEIKAVPLSSYGQAYTPHPWKVDPAFDMKILVRDQVNTMVSSAYFKLFAALLKTSSPYPEDAPMVAKLHALGIEPGQDFDIAKVDPMVAEALAKAPK